jgi:predicted HAD superfamily hydrolase
VSKQVLKNPLQTLERRHISNREEAFHRLKTENAEIANIKNKTKSEISQLVEKFPIISFDIFDTILYRSITHPTAVFELLEELHGVPNFRNKRIKMETNARDANSILRGTREVDLEQIYSANKSLWFMKKNELDLEEKLLTSNSFLKGVINECIILKKKVILVSDTYFDTEFISKILKREEIEFNDLFLSSELGKSKAEGSLFRHVLETLDVSSNSILHIGDNYRSDFLLPKQSGMTALHLRNIHESAKGESNRNVIDQNTTHSKLISGINNVKKVDGNNSYWFQFGFSTVGPILVGWCSWIKKQIQVSVPATVFFLSRDGFLPYKYFNEHPIKGVDFKYLHVSRILLLKQTFLVDKTRFFKEIARFNLIRVIDLLETYGLTEYLRVEDFFTQEELNSFIKKSIRRRIEHFFISNKEIIAEKFTQQTETYKEYLLVETNCRGRKFIVDIGWKGTNQELIQTVLKTQFQGLYLGLWDNAELQDKDSWAFKREKNSAISLIALNGIEILETAFSAKEGHPLRVTKQSNVNLKYNFELETPNLERIFQQEEIFRGAMSFWKKLESILSADSILVDPNICFAQISAVILNPNPEDLIHLGNVEHKVLSGSTQAETPLISKSLREKSHWKQGEFRLTARYGNFSSKVLFIPRILYFYGPLKTVSAIIIFFKTRMIRVYSAHLVGARWKKWILLFKYWIRRLGV